MAMSSMQRQASVSRRTWLLAAGGLLLLGAPGAAHARQAGATLPGTRMQGLYTYMADSGSFTDCVSGNRFPVAAEGDNVRLQEAYLATRRTPGAGLVAWLEGHIAERERMEGGGTHSVLVVDRFIALEPQAHCVAVHGNRPLEGTSWRLTALEGRGVEAAVAPPLLVLRPARRRIVGSTGCNRLDGRYRLEGDRLVLSPRIRAVRRACPAGMAQEEAFLRVLDAVTGWHVAGDSLRLLDRNSIAVAVFQAAGPRS